jgi:phasin family protein
MNAVNLDDFQNFSKQQVEFATSFAATLSKGMQEIAAEAADYSKHAMSANADVVERLMGAKSVETAVQIQSDFAKSSYEGFVAKATKINEIVTKLATEAFKPAQSAFSAVTKV